MQGAYDDVLERMKGQSNKLLAALGGSPGCVVLGSADETALGQVRFCCQYLCKWCLVPAAWWASCVCSLTSCDGPDFPPLLTSAQVPGSHC